MKKYRLTASIVFACIVAGIAAGVVFLHEGQRSTDMTLEHIKSLHVTDPAVEAFWEAVVVERGGREAYQLLKETYAGADQNEQHTYAHVFGKALYNGMGIDGVAVCDSDFAFGCYHSFFGWALADRGLSILKDLDQACIDAYGRKGLGCQHGIGHGVIAELGYDHLTESLETCMQLDWQEPIGGCTSGAFMEFNFNTMKEMGTREPVDGDEYYPCTAVPSQFTQACYFEQPAWWSVRNDHDYSVVGELCGAVPGSKDREACFLGTGNVIAGISHYDIEGIDEWCGTMPTEEGRFQCVEGATWVISNQPEYRDTWQQLCEPYTGEYYDRCIKSHDFI